MKGPWADGKVAQGQHRKGHAGIAGADLGGVGAGMCLVFMVARTLAAAGLSLTDGLFRGEVVGRRVLPQLLAWNLPRAFPHLDFGAWLAGWAIAGLFPKRFPKRFPNRFPGSSPAFSPFAYDGIMGGAVEAMEGMTIRAGLCAWACGALRVGVRGDWYAGGRHGVWCGDSGNGGAGGGVSGDGDGERREFAGIGGGGGGN